MENPSTICCPGSLFLDWKYWQIIVENIPGAPVDFYLTVDKILSNSTAFVLETLNKYFKSSKNTFAGSAVSCITDNGRGEPICYYNNNDYFTLVAQKEHWASII